MDDNLVTRREEGLVKDVGWRAIRDIYRKRKSEGVYLEGYYFRHSRGFEEGYQRVYVRSFLYGPIDDYWHIVEEKTQIHSCA